MTLASSACTVDRVVATARGADAGQRDAGPDELTLEREWGVFAETLPLPPCVDGGVLLVNTVADELQGGSTLSTLAEAGPTLSFREALFLAQNSPGPHRIHFDPAVFPPNAAATIHVIDGALRFPGSLVATCIDARGRGVIVAFDFAQTCDLCTWHMGAGSQMSGMVLKGNMGKLGVGSAVIAGNRFMISYQALQIADGAVIGPWNVFGHGAYGVRLDFYFANTPARIEGNYFGVEPTTRADLGLTVGISLFQRARVSDNVSNSTLQISGAPGGTITQNQLLRLGGYPLLTVQGEGWVVSQNRLEGGANNFLGLGPNGNSFSSNIIEGSFNSDGKGAPPTDAGVGSISGTCPEAGTVEVLIRSGTTWAPMGTGSCLGATWSATSPQLTAGVEASTLFTPALTRHTGPLSPSLQVPGTP